MPALVNLYPIGRQLELFPDPQEQKLRRLDRVIDEVRDRYGNEALQRKHEGLGGL